MRILAVFLLVALFGCAIISDDGLFTLDGPYTDYDAFSQAELAPFPPFSGRFIHFEGTPFVLHAGVRCRTQAVDTLDMFELLELEPGVDVEKWIFYHHADFGNEYADVEPRRHTLRSGTARLVDVRVEQQELAYKPGPPVTVDVMYYRLEAQRLLFENAHVPSVQTEEHRCFLGDGFGRMTSP